MTHIVNLIFVHSGLEVLPPKGLHYKQVSSWPTTTHTSASWNFRNWEPGPLAIIWKGQTGRVRCETLDGKSENWRIGSADQPFYPDFTSTPPRRIIVGVYVWNYQDWRWCSSHESVLLYQVRARDSRIVKTNIHSIVWNRWNWRVWW